jgi:anion-transporting  ArsA/GET3 family ATPase
MLGKAWWHTTETLPDGSRKYDVVLLDAPATGHGLDMLRVPTVILDVVPPGILRRDAERAWALMRDPRACEVVLVTLPEEMPVTETVELASSLKALGLPSYRVVVNAALSPLFSDADRAALAGLSGLGGAEPALRAAQASTAAAAALASAMLRANRERLEQEMLERLSVALSVTPTVLPLLLDDVRGPDDLRQLGERLVGPGDATRS